MNLKTLLTLLVTCIGIQCYAYSIKGKVIDKQTQEPLIGATVQLLGTTMGTVTDIDGNFELKGLSGKHAIIAQYVAYIPLQIIVEPSMKNDLILALAPDTKQLSEVTVTAEAKRNTENAMIAQQRQSLVIQTGVSAQQISRTNDKDASEVIRRVPGVSIIDEKYVMVRGLSQRYNNVWLNNSAVPASEADSRAFSFDVIPSSQLDNLLIVKSPSPEYPADFTGGFILIQTKDVPTKNSFQVGMSGGLNTQTHFKGFLYNEGSNTDLLGFDGGLRSLHDGIHRTMNVFPGTERIDLMNNHLNNDWSLQQKEPAGDFGLGLNFTKGYEFSSGARFSTLGSLNYSNSYKTYLNMENSLFGAYDHTHDNSVYLRKSTDNQYNNDVRLGAMLNFTYLSAGGKNRYELRSLFNQLGKNRYTSRRGFNAQSDNEESAEYYYSSRSTYSGQFTGRHNRDKGEQLLDWALGYAYSNRNLPDRRRYVLTDAFVRNEMVLANGNDVDREFTYLSEHVMTGNVNFARNLEFGELKPRLKAGVYGEYRTRGYNTRLFVYGWDPTNNTLPQDFRTLDIPTGLMQEAHYGQQGLYLQEVLDWTNNYDAHNTLGAGYVSMNLPFGKWNIYAGVRYEYNRLELVSNTKTYEKSPKSRDYIDTDFFPSVNTTYRINEKNQLRLSYGRSINRPEFREVSPSVYYDFDLASNVQGNVGLKSAYINNFDLAYEFYPSQGELINVSLFYKQFRNPIEWTYSVNGGTDLTYSFINARGANNYGIEVDIRKQLDDIGLPNLSWSFNGSLIMSRVTFEEGQVEEDRPMQGQSPYLINTGLFYSHPTHGWNASLLYNRIGKRIIGVGRNLGNGNDNLRIPDSYEMPRNAIDISLSKKWDKFEAKIAVKDLLAEKVSFKQFQKTNHGEIEQITRQYRPGSNLQLTINYRF